MLPAPYSLLPAPYSLLPAPCSLLPAPCSLLPALISVNPAHVERANAVGAHLCVRPNDPRTHAPAAHRRPRPCFTQTPRTSRGQTRSGRTCVCALMTPRTHAPAAHRRPRPCFTRTPRTSRGQTHRFAPTCSLLLAPCSLFPAPCSLLLAPCSLLPVHCSLCSFPRTPRTSRGQTRSGRTCVCALMTPRILPVPRGQTHRFAPTGKWRTRRGAPVCAPS
jgi:hypothetical protein